MRYIVLRHRDGQVKLFSHPEEALTALQSRDQLYVGRSLAELRKLYPGELAEAEEDVRPAKKPESRSAKAPAAARTGTVTRTPRTRTVIAQGSAP